MNKSNLDEICHDPLSVELWHVYI